MDKLIAKEAFDAIKKVCSDNGPNGYNRDINIEYPEFEIESKSVAELIEFFKLLKYRIFSGYSNYTRDGCHMFNDRMSLIIKICKMAESDLKSVRAPSIPYVMANADIEIMFPNNK